MPSPSSDQIRMFRRYAMGDLPTMLLQVSKDPAMIIWLDNQQNHKGAINENYGRELLELFSMGVGNYTEDDVKECARAFTGWTIGNREYMEIRSARDSDWPYGRISWHFVYDEEDHDEGEKRFLGETGNFNGDDIVEIICRQPATAQFIARHMYHFFVADEPPVPQWPYESPRDPEAIEELCQAYFDSNYDISAMLRALFNSDFFKSESCWYEKVKSPSELVTGVLRLTELLDRPRYDVGNKRLRIDFMGQKLSNPPLGRGMGRRPSVDRHRRPSGEDELRVRGARQHQDPRLQGADEAHSRGQRRHGNAGAPGGHLLGSPGGHLREGGDARPDRGVQHEERGTSGSTGWSSTRRPSKAWPTWSS